MVHLPPAIRTVYGYLLPYTHGTAISWYTHMAQQPFTIYTWHYFLLYTHCTPTSYYLHRVQLSPSIHRDHSYLLIYRHFTLPPATHTGHSYLNMYKKRTATSCYTYTHCTATSLYTDIAHYLLLHTQGTATFICTKREQVPPAKHIRIAQLPSPTLTCTATFSKIHMSQLPPFVQALHSYLLQHWHGTATLCYIHMTWLPPEIHARHRSTSLLNTQRISTYFRAHRSQLCPTRGYGIAWGLREMGSAQGKGVN